MALTCTIAVVALVACGAPSAGPPRPSATGPTDGGGLFRGAQPWTADVSGAPASERSAAILTALTDAGGWGNGNVLQIDFAMPVLTAGPDAPRMTVTGNADYCFGGVDCDPVPAEMPVPPGAHMEGSQDLTCDAANEDCHLLVADPAAAAAVRDLPGHPGRRGSDRRRLLRLGPRPGLHRRAARSAVHQRRRGGLPDRRDDPDRRRGRGRPDRPRAALHPAQRPDEGRRLRPARHPRRRAGEHEPRRPALRRQPAPALRRRHVAYTPRSGW